MYQKCDGFISFIMDHYSLKFSFLAEVKEQDRLLRSSSDDVEDNNEIPGDGSNNKDLQEPNLTDPVVGNASQVPEGVNIASTQVSRVLCTYFS